MTGRELLERLRELTDEQLEAEVTTEGCDCVGDVGSVEVDTYEIYLARSKP